MRKFTLKQPLTIKLSPVGKSAVEARSPGLAVIGMGTSIEDALDQFQEMLELQWEALCECPLHELTADALRERRRLESLLIPVIEEDA